MNKSLALLGASFVAVASSQAVVVNGNFEDPPLSAGQFNTTLPGWQQSGGNAGVWHLPSSGFFNTTAPEGVQIGYSNATFVAQQLTDVIVEGDNQVLLYAGRRSDGFDGSFDFQLIAGGSIANGQNTTGSVLGTIHYVHTDFNPTTFTELVLTYTALANDPMIGQQVTLQFIKTAGQQMNFDDVRFNAVPEPMTLGLLALAPLAFKRRKK